MSNVPVTKCPQCGTECEEQFFPPVKADEGWNVYQDEEGNLKASRRYGRAIEFHPYPMGGTFLICKGCAAYTFYPRESKNGT